MDTGSVSVPRVEVVRAELDYGHATAGAEIVAALAAIAPSAGRAFRLPLATERAVVELAGVPTAVANALRRVLTDELRGRCLTFDRDGFDRAGSTDPFMNDDFVRTRIRMLPLRPQISDETVRTLRLALDAANHTDATMLVYGGDLVVTAGELAEPLFNPTHVLAFLQPGRTLRITGIRLAEGFGNQDAAFVVGVRAVSRPLDLEEVPREETHRPGGAAVAQSGFVESSLVANPRRHEVSVSFLAVPAGSGAAVALLLDACAAVMRRLRYVQGVLEAARRRAGAATFRAADAYFLVSAEDGRMKGVLGVKGETDTIGRLLERSVYELMPDISYVGYTCVPHEKMMKLTVAHSADRDEIGAIVARAAKHAYGIFSQIQRGIRARAA